MLIPPDNKLVIVSKPLMFKYGKMQKVIPSQLVCGSCGMCLDCTLPGVQVTAGLGLFCAQNHLSDCGDSNPCSKRPAGP